MIKKMSLRKSITFFIFVYIIIYSVYYWISIPTGFLSEASLKELVDATFLSYPQHIIPPIFPLLIISYPLWMGILFVIYEKKSSDKKITTLFGNLIYIAPLIIITQLVVIMFLTYISPINPVLSNYLSESWKILYDILVSVMVSILWIGIMLIIRLFFSTDWIVVLLSVVLYYFHSLVDISVIIPFLKKIFNSSVILSDAIIFNNLGVNDNLSNGGGYYIFCRLFIMITFYYFLYYLVRRWRMKKL